MTLRRIPITEARTSAMTWEAQVSDPRYVVIRPEGAWSYVVNKDDPHDVPDHCGPWRYREDAQDYADELNELNATGLHG